MSEPVNGNGRKSGAVHLLVAVALLIGGAVLGRIIFDPAVLLEKIAVLNANQQQLLADNRALGERIASMEMRIEVATRVAKELVEIRASIEALKERSRP